MESIKNSFKHDYNLAVDCFNKKDYTSFFRNIRPAIELLCKLVIYDIINNDVTSADIMEGRKSIQKGRDNIFFLDTRPTTRKPTGSFFTAIFPRAYFMHHPDVYSAREDIQKKRLKLSIESYSSELCRWYNFASEFGSHTGGSTMQEEEQARGCATCIPGFLDFLKGNSILSSDTIEFLNGLQPFSFNSVREKELNQVKNQIEQANKEIDEKAAALILAKKQLAEAEQRNLASQERTSEAESLLAEKQKEIEKLKKMLSDSKVIETPTIEEELIPEAPIVYKPQRERHLRERMRLAVEDWDLDEDSLDDDQLDLIDDAINKSMLVTGCAGSGKSVIAMHKAEQIAEKGFSVILIALTRSLSSFMQTGRNSSSYTFYHYHYWKYLGMPRADYIIVDEIQDFEREEIQEFIDAANKHYFFFGDSAQSIYNHFGKNTLSIEDIAEMTRLTPLQLYNNYRLPRNVAKITQDYVGVNVMEYAEKVYKNKEKELPHFIQFNTIEEQISKIIEIAKNNPDHSIGVLLPSNQQVVEVCEKLKIQDFDYEFKFKTEAQDKRAQGELHFTNNLPKVLTYHSAKGLQFDIVIIPMFKGAKSNEARKALYVAMTRTMHQLYLMYNTPQLAAPLDKVPSRLYKKS